MKTIHCGPFPCGCKVFLGDVNFREVLTFFLCDIHAELVRPEVKALAHKMRAIVRGKQNPRPEGEKNEPNPNFLQL